jgi:subtilisin family serine protease
VKARQIIGIAAVLAAAVALLGLSRLPAARPPSGPCQTAAPGPSTAFTPQPAFPAAIPRTGTVTAAASHGPGAAAATDTRSWDPGAGRTLVALQELPDPANPSLKRRVRIVQANFKYAYWRIEETVRPADAAGSPDTVLARQAMIADHAMVRLRPGVTLADLTALADRHGLTVRKTMNMPNCYLVACPGATPDSLPDLLALLMRESTLIQYAEPDYLLRHQQTLPDDPQFGSLWGLHNTGQDGGARNADINAPEAWDVATGSPEPVVAIIDSGVDDTHPDLASNLWTNTLDPANGVDDDGNGYRDDARGWDFVGNDNQPSDENTHGTHCAGIVGATGNNGIGVVGVTWRCRLMPLRFLDGSGSGTSSDAIEAIQYATLMRRRGVPLSVISASWGGGGYEQTMANAIQAAAEAGILFVAAAGNAGSNNDLYPFYPSSYPHSNIIAVAATDRRDALAGFSQYGAVSVDLAAPGVDIYSTLPGAYGTKSGTSMATPYVAGVAALLWSLWPEAPWAEVRDAILTGADPLPALAGRTVTGGRLNAAQALRAFFRILHDPPGNAYYRDTNHVLEASIGPAALTDPTQVVLFWRTDETSPYTQTPMERVSNTLFRGSIPPQPLYTTLHYWFQATATNGESRRHPALAPATAHAFTVMPPVTLTVTGAPSLEGLPTPPYGAHVYPSGQVFAATAPAHTEPVAGARWACGGWLGAGSIPAAGPSNTVEFTLAEPSTLEWQWTREFALVHTSTVGNVLNATTWWTEGAAATGLTAQASFTRLGTNFSFAYWTLDGQRRPDGTRPAVNPVTAIPMNAPRRLQALYLPTLQDADLDGMPDWWECFQFGDSSATPGDDADGDGAGNLAEYQDRTNPQDSGAYPIPPVILHTPLADPQARPAPFVVNATVTDNYQVAEVVLHWQRNDGPEGVTNLAPRDGTSFEGQIPAPGVAGDRFAYWFTARDPSGNSATHGPHTFRVSYPLIGGLPDRLDALIQPGAASALPLTLLNGGTTTLVVQATLLGMGHSNAFEEGAGSWSHGGTNDRWTLDANRWVSPSNAWYCGDPTSRVYASWMRAWLDTPPVYLGPAARLAFDHWIQSELDVQFWRYGWKPTDCWDGGIVELSTNGGAAFFQIAPTGGYTHTLSGWSDAPWADNTPCFAGTGGWRHVEFDLAAFTGKVVIVRFHFGSDSNTEEEGWRLDNVRITPVGSTSPWLHLAVADATVPPGLTGTVVAAFDSAGMATGDRETALHITCNDPTRPVTEIPVKLRVRSPPRQQWLGAAQTSRDGTGIVTLTNRVWDADSEPCSLILSWSTNQGLTWAPLPAAAVQASTGTATVTGAGEPTIGAIVTGAGAGPLTNQIEITWNTITGAAPIALSTATLVRAQAWDGLFAGAWVTSQPFLVDNAAPPTPNPFQCLSQTPMRWSRQPEFALRWDTVKETVGSGLKGYEYGFTDSGGQSWSNLTLTRVAVTAKAPDGTNLWAWVRARDQYGNGSEPALLGPYWIDATPPSAAQARVTVQLSPFGTYRVGVTPAPGSWTGFSDGGSGIAGYYLSLADGGGTTNGIWSPAPAGTLSGLVPNATNTFFVWARDEAGGIGAAACQSFLVLAATADPDGDGFTAAQEEVAGTDALNADSALRLMAAATGGRTGDTFVIRWFGVTNRLYSLSAAPSLLSVGEWTGVPGGTNLPGPGALMEYADPIGTATARFYRITVRQP